MSKKKVKKKSKKNLSSNNLNKEVKKEKVYTKERIISAIIAIFLIFTLILSLSSCMGTVSLEKSAKLLAQYYVKHDESALRKLGASSETAKEGIETEKAERKKEIQSSFARSGVEASDEQLEKIYEAQMEALKKVTITTDIVSEEEDTAEVKISMNYIDVESIDEKAAEEAFKDIEEGQSNSDKLKKECLEKYVDNLVKGLEEAKPSTEKNEAIFTFEKGAMSWVPEEMELFTEGIDSLMSN
mgnify:CR=1 FL=1